MSSTVCPTCEGRGWVCARCGVRNHPPESQRRRDYGRGCRCYRAKTIRCPKHEATRHTCDFCGQGCERLSYLMNALMNAPRHAGEACPSCVVSWANWLAVAFDGWLSLDKRPPPLCSEGGADANEPKA